jgi:hypothetical protein
MGFSSLGFTFYDVALVIACTFGAVVGSFAHAIVGTISLDGPPNKEGVLMVASPSIRMARGTWLTLRMMLGGILGFMFGLYFIGALNETPGTFAKIWAMSFLVGYAAPKLWAAKEEALMSQVSAGKAQVKRLVDLP